MSYVFPLDLRNEVIAKESLFNDENGSLNAFAEYIHTEKTKSKAPLIIVGAGASTTNVHIKKPPAWKSESGLPLFAPLMLKLKDILIKADISASDIEAVDLRKLFSELSESMIDVDREWLSKIFSAINSTKSKTIKDVWHDFCMWFFFESISDIEGNCCGALNADYSDTSLEIAKLCKSTSALCLSANFDNFIAHAMTDGSAKGLSLHKKQDVELYFKRISKKLGSKKNHYVLHSNGDIFWLHCSGDRDEGYCINKGKPVPAFLSMEYNSKHDLQCGFCGSKLESYMTMPGTYEKDVNTLSIVSQIWRYIASRTSCLITVGLSCNWDDVLLRFIISLLLERDIPHLDINDFSCKVNKEQSLLVEKVTRNKRFNSFCINSDGSTGLKYINEKIMDTNSTIDYDLSNGWQQDVKDTIESLGAIVRLKGISQIGMKSYWITDSEDNNRWDHSVEVAETADNMYLRLCSNSGKPVVAFERVLLYITGLLHDCGHLPFSHLIEDVFNELSWRTGSEQQPFDHNQYAAMLINGFYKTESAFKELLDKYALTVDEIVSLINGSYGVSYMDALINGAIDADKISYVFTDAEKAKKALALNEGEYIEKLMEYAYISDEYQVAFEASSAWYAFRLLDERFRMFEELYFRTGIRCLEAALKYIIILYFVQRNSIVDYETMLKSKKHFYSDELATMDLGYFKITMAISDLFALMVDDDTSYEYHDFSKSLGSQTEAAIESCMNLIMRAYNPDQQAPKEVLIIKRIYKQLTGRDYTIPNGQVMTLDDVESEHHYFDSELADLTSKLSIKQLSNVRKKIMLNYPGTILIDVHKYTSYFSIPLGRRARRRIDGTSEPMETVFIPVGDLDTWAREQSPATIGISEYKSEYIDSLRKKPVFNVFLIGADKSKNEHAINMLKKELIREKGKES